MTSPVIEASNVTVAFGDVVALDGVTITTPSNSFTAIIGPNGAGKSTLLKVLLGLQRPPIIAVNEFDGVVIVTPSSATTSPNATVTFEASITGDVIPMPPSSAARCT